MASADGEIRNLQGTLAIVGLGLLGASLAEAVRRRFPGIRLIGISSPEATQGLLEAGVIHEGYGYSDWANPLSQSDFVILCTPIDKILAQLDAMQSLVFKAGAIVSDVGSTKTEICARGQAALAGKGAHFMGSHPMAGSEKTGWKHRDPLLFENAVWVVCPPTEDSPTLHEISKKFKALLTGVGARVLALDPQDHDRRVAAISHFPQLLSTALAAFLAQKPEAEVADALAVAGPGFRDMTRLSASSHAIWDPILRTNQGPVDDLLNGFTRHLEAFSQRVSDGETEIDFSQAQGLRRHWNAPRKGLAGPLTEIVVDLEDKPGALRAALNPLDAEGLNIQDLELLKVREGDAGVLMMGFKRPAEAEKALASLAVAGYRARLR
jgi:prephenate dehydrogenase